MKQTSVVVNSNTVISCVKCQRVLWQTSWDLWHPCACLRDSAQRGEENVRHSAQDTLDTYNAAYAVGFREGVERAARAAGGAMTNPCYNDVRCDVLNSIRRLLPPAQPEPANSTDLKRLLEAIQSAWAAFGDNLESQAMDGHGITREYAHAVQKDLKWAESFVESLKSQPEPSPAKMSREDLTDGMVKRFLKLTHDEDGNNLRWDWPEVADAALAYMEKNWGPR